jgi:hypothetical protein
MEQHILYVTEIHRRENLDYSLSERKVISKELDQSEIVTEYRLGNAGPTDGNHCQNFLCRDFLFLVGSGAVRSCNTKISNGVFAYYFIGTTGDCNSDHKSGNSND